ncbi:MAG: hypothetical protein AAFV53_40740 [Myxococcota bacterium]
MAAIDLSDASGTVIGGQTISATASENEVTINPGAQELHVYLDDSAAGTFGMLSASQAPLPGQTWLKIWERPQQRTGDGDYTIFVASGGGSVTLFYRLVK